jgi:P27 family predicted phage terminase small subunit
MAKSKKYSEYSERTQKFMNAVEKHLQTKMGNVESQWDGVLAMLATNFELFWKCKETISEEGLMVKNRFGQWDKHPLLKSQMEAQIQVIKLVNEFGLSPKAVKNLTVIGDNEDDFIEELTK